MRFVRVRRFGETISETVTLINEKSVKKVENQDGLGDIVTDFNGHTWKYVEVDDPPFGSRYAHSLVEI